MASVITEKNYTRLATAITLSSLGLSLMVIFQYLSVHALSWQVFPQWDGAVGATFGQPNFLAGYVLVSLPFTSQTIQTFLTKKSPHWWWLAMGIQCTAIACTYSWGAMGGVALLAGLTLIQRFAVLRYRLVLWIMCALGAIVGFLSVSYYQAQQEFVFESRVRIFTHLLTASQVRPWLGWGIANVDHAFRTSATRDGFLHDVYVDKAHSELVEVVVTSGVVGGFTYLIMLGFVIQQLWRGVRKNSPSHLTSMFVLLLYLFHAQTNVISISEQLLFWFVVGHALREPLELA